MAKQDDAKREEWRRRFERYLSKDQSIADFCRAEGVGVHKFYYWSKQLRRPPERGGQRSRRRAGTAQVEAVETEAALPAARVVRFTWDSGLSFSVPADCLDAIRCVLEYADEQRLAAQSDEAGAPRFRQVIVG